jgi:hypothetical protein
VYLGATENKGKEKMKEERKEGREDKVILSKHSLVAYTKIIIYQN